MANVILKNIRKVYDKNVVAVDNFNLEIKDNEFIVFVGPSGCGKSTTLRMIAGLEKITDGECYIDNKLVNNVAPKDRDIAMVFQNYALYPHMTVFDNMAFALKLRKEKKDVINKRVQEAAEILDIQEYLNRKPKALSGGQRQRVAIGRAIVRQPKVFLMDEPLSNLEAKLRNQMRTELIKLRNKVKTTFIYVTHDQVEAMTLGDRIVVMKDGVIQQIGTPQDVYSKPSNVFVAGFIGSPQINMLTGEIVKIEDEFFVRYNGNDIKKLSEAEAQTMNVDAESIKKVLIGIRPEHIKLTEKEDKDSIKTDVDLSEMMGGELFLHVLAKDDQINIKITEPDNIFRYVFSNGEKNSVNIKFLSTKIHLFDIDSGKRL